MGDPLDEATDIGTIISREQYEKVKEYIRIGESTPGARSFVCSRLPDSPALKEGLFVRPVIFAGLSNDTRLAREEIFGPVTCIIKFESYDDAIDQANDSEYGLAATIWTQDLRTALQGAMQLEAGFVQVNQNLVVTSNLSYGGIKNSGLGKEASLEAMLEHFTHKKTIILNMQ
jgi:acyl-CoA reductase-like NAD-dependent aldehyde dehydrogenase